MSSSFLFFDLLIIGSGLYLIYVAYNMKKTGEINGTVIVGKNCDVSKAKDKQGFIDYMYKKSMIMGGIIALGGAVDYVNEKYLEVPYLGLISSIVFFIMIMVYCKISMDAQKKYLEPDLKSKIKKTK